MPDLTVAQRLATAARVADAMAPAYLDLKRHVIATRAKYPHADKAIAPYFELLADLATLMSSAERALSEV